jgi:LPXTG-motif cell wall-anchored protein
MIAVVFNSWYLIAFVVIGVAFLFLTRKKKAQ